MTTPDLERRLRRIEDIEAIKRLKAAYCAACDGGWNGKASHDVDAIVAFFAEDGVWDGGVYGSRQGRAALRGYYEAQRATNPPLAYHLLTNPIIEVDGDRATGRWRLTILLTMADGASALVGGDFDDDYVRTAEGWRIARSRYTLALSGRYEAAWFAAEAALAPGA